MQKAYASKEELLAAMFSRLRESAGVIPEGEPGRPTLHGWLLTLLMAAMPVDEERRARQLHASAFAERRAFDPAIGGAIARSDNKLRGMLAGLVRRAQGEGELSADLDPELVAWSVFALAQGVVNQLLYEPAPEDLVRERLDDALRRLIGA